MLNRNVNYPISILPLNYTKKSIIMQLQKLLKSIAISALLCYNKDMKHFLPENTTEVYCQYTSTQTPKTSDFYDSHIHNNYEMLFFCDGDADFIISGSIYHLQKNDLLLIKPSVYHNLRLLSARSYERVIIHFQEGALFGELASFVQNDANNVYHVETNSPIKRIFDNIREASDLFSKEEFDYLAKTSLNQILLHLKHLSARVLNEKIPSVSTLERVLLYIDENPALPLTISSLSEKFNLSESWIAHSFKKVLGVSPSQYINRKKIIYAQSLINMGIHPVQVAEICGYVNYTTFYRQYKKYLGVSPAQDVKEE